MIPFVDFWQDNGIPLTWQPKSQTTTWFSTDSKENYEKNRDKNFFSPDSFGYNFNNYGYRIGSTDWNFNSDQKKIITLGCSHSVGIGVPWENTWAYLLAQQLNCELFNLSVTGGTPDTVFRTLYFSLEKIKPDVVAIFWPAPIRWEFYEAMPWDATGADCNTPKLLSVWNTDANQINENHLINNRNKNILSVRLLQKIYGFKLLELDSESAITDYISSGNELSVDARDLIHPGVSMHQYTAKKFIDTY